MPGFCRITELDILGQVYQERYLANDSISEEKNVLLRLKDFFIFFCICIWLSVAVKPDPIWF